MPWPFGPHMPLVERPLVIADEDGAATDEDAMTGLVADRLDGVMLGDGGLLVRAV